MLLSGAILGIRGLRPSNRNEAVADGDGHGLSAVYRPQLSQYLPCVFFDGSTGNTENFARFPRRLAYGNPCKHLSLPICEDRLSRRLRGAKTTDPVGCIKRHETERSFHMRHQSSVPPPKAS